MEAREWMGMVRHRDFCNVKYFWIGTSVLFVMMWINTAWVDMHLQGHMTSELLLGKYPPKDVELTCYLTGALGPVVQLFIPMVEGFLAVMYLLDKQKSHFKRYEIFRIGKLRYHIGNYLGGCLISGIALVLAYTIYAGSVYVFLYDKIAFGSYMGTYLKQVVQVFLYGATNGIMSLLLSTCFRSRYLTICIPVLICYLYKSCYNFFAIIVEFKYLDILDALRFSGILNAWSEISVLTYVYYLVWFWVGGILYCLMQYRRKDCGV